MIDFFKKGVRFFKRYSLKDPLFVAMYGIAYFQKEYNTHVQFYSTQGLFNEIVHGKSLIRIGDGEISMLRGLDISYQKYEKRLFKAIKEIIRGYSESSHYILSIPAFAGYGNSKLSKTKDKIRCWLPLKVEFRKSFNKKMKYADAHIFYHKEIMWQFFLQFLKDTDVVFVTNQKTADSLKNMDYSFNSVEYVTTSDENAFSHALSVREKIDTALIHNPKAKLVFSCGPLGKFLALLYVESGYICYDLGFGLRSLYSNEDYSGRI